MCYEVLANPHASWPILLPSFLISRNVVSYSLAWGGGEADTEQRAKEGVWLAEWQLLPNPQTHHPTHHT